ncbi:hypothetical protein PVAP13_5KG627100 [Panicum virgatum]|uniref:Uncharacterized protein n=1 Tax=Panicum virgatum TaxID=38727 RepID=A0A8T0SQW2_PANVG|nr:hypothetical protein PVAP13_5KG627100 [Panicum virgatum]
MAAPVHSGTTRRWSVAGSTLWGSDLPSRPPDLLPWGLGVAGFCSCSGARLRSRGMPAAGMAGLDTARASMRQGAAAARPTAEVPAVCPRVAREHRGRSPVLARSATGLGLAAPTLGVAGLSSAAFAAGVRRVATAWPGGEGALPFSCLGAIWYATVPLELVGVLAKAECV